MDTMAGTATARRAAPQWLRRRVDSQDLRVGFWPGRGRGPEPVPLFFFNGIGARMELLAPLVHELDPARPVLSFDVPGVGESPSPLLPYPLWRVARLAAEVLDQMRIARVDVLGASWGGALAQQFAIQSGQRCRRLVLAATMAGGLTVLGSPDALARMLAPPHANGADPLQDLGALYGGTARHDATGLSVLARLAQPASRRGYLYQQLALAGWASAPFLPFLQHPTLVMAGRDDPIVPPVNGRILAQLIPHSALKVYEDGHLFLHYKARECAKDVEAFLRAEEPGGSPPARGPVEAGVPAPI